jgi:hypothetical protein
LGAFDLSVASWGLIKPGIFADVAPLIEWVLECLILNSTKRQFSTKPAGSAVTLGVISEARLKSVTWARAVASPSLRR